MPIDLELGRLIARFGAREILGRPLELREVRRIQYAEWVEQAYVSFMRSEDRESWERNNPNAAQVLFREMKEARDAGR